MHKAIPFYDYLCREYSLLLRAINRRTLDERHEQWRYWQRIANRYGYMPTMQGWKTFRADLVALEFI
jgi:hypothetical protein